MYPKRIRAAFLLFLSFLLAQSAIGQGDNANSNMPISAANDSLGSLKQLVLQEPAPVTWNVLWKQGVRVESSDGRFKTRFGGRIQVDYLKINPGAYYDSLVEFTQGIEFRRLRFYNSGIIYGNIVYKLQLDFAVGIAVLKDAYIGIKDVPFIGNIRAGHFKEPIGLELLNSSNYMPFMERGLTNPLTPERNTGIMIFDHFAQKRMTYALGYFMPSNATGFGLYAGNRYHISGRLTGLPIFEEENGYKVLHLGTSLTRQDQNNSLYILSSRPETHLAPKVVLAEIDKADFVNQIGLETSLILGSWNIQGEYIATRAHTSPESQLQNEHYDFNAFYISTGYFLTGEHRNYKASDGAFTRTDPKRNFSEGPGAWEIALRFSAIDLDDTDINGGTLSEFTVGLNWYLNPSTRLMFNYLIADVKGKGRLTSFQTRFHIFF